MDKQTRTYGQPYSDSKLYRPINMIPVKSSRIESIGYDADRKMLAVIFRYGKGDVYHYPESADYTMFQKFLKAKSKDGFFREHFQKALFLKFPASVLNEAEVQEKDV